MRSGRLAQIADDASTPGNGARRRAPGCRGPRAGRGRPAAAVWNDLSSRRSSRPLQLVDETHGLAPDMRGERRVDDRLDLACLDAFLADGLEIEDFVGRFQDVVAAHIAEAFAQERILQLVRLADKQTLVRIEQVRDEARVLAHGLRPEVHYLGAVQVDLFAVVKLKARREAVCFPRSVLEEKWPDQAAHLRRGLMFAHGFLV